jgi:two-component system chemotaxis sensor kinase CheA
MLNLRGELMPLFRLYKLFDIGGAREDPCESLVVVISGEGSRCAVLVDALVGQQQVVIKTLGKTFDGLEGVSGGAIMGDGRIALILDTSGLVRAARQFG